MGKYERAIWRDGQDSDPGSPQPFAPAAPDHRPQDLHGDGSGLRFETLDHGGHEPDMMPQAIRVTDSQGRSCLYVPVGTIGADDDSHYVELNPSDTWLGG